MATIRINMTGKNLEITEALRSYVERRLPSSKNTSMITRITRQK